MLFDCFEEHLRNCYVICIRKIDLVLVYFDKNTLFPEGKFNIFISFNFKFQKALGENVRGVHNLEE